MSDQQLHELQRAAAENRNESRTGRTPTVHTVTPTVLGNRSMECRCTG